MRRLEWLEHVNKMDSKLLKLLSIIDRIIKGVKEALD